MYTVFIAKEDIQRRSELMDGSAAGSVRNGITRTALVGLRMIWTI